MKSPLGALAALTTKTPVPYVRRSPGSSGVFGGLLGGGRGVEAQMRAMGSVGTLFAIVNRTSNATALVNWRLYRKPRPGRDEERTEVTSHAALDLWNRPNPFMPRQEFVETSQQHVDLVGEGWWVIARHPRFSIPLELWPMRPDRMDVIPSRDGFLAGYVYRGPDGEQIPLGLNEVIQIRMPNPLDPYRGMGPVQSVLTDLDATKYSAEWNRSFFLNSAEPGGIIEVPNRLGDDEFDELRARWNDQHKGVANAHRVAILEHGAWKDRKLSQRDMQFVELRDVSSKVIREAFGIPKFAVGDVEDINRATAEASKAWFAEQLTVPRLERIKAALNHDLLPLFGATAAGLEFDYDDPVPPDAETRRADLTAKATAAATLIAAGAYGPAVLEALDLPEVPFGQPGADPDRELLIELVKGAPAHLAELILPLLGFDLPDRGAAPDAENRDRIEVTAARERLALPAGDEPTDGEATGGDIDNAARWVVVTESDDDVCGPCGANDGKTYRTRREAYRDYPGGSGYVKCVGAKYGNDCRCRVVKRRGRPRNGDSGE